MSPTSTGTSLARELIDDLGAQIAGGHVAPGTILSMDALSQQRGISRPVVREAIGVLAAMGLVESKRRRGSMVRPPSEWNWFDPKVITWRLDDPETRANQFQSLVELRTAIEPAAAGLTATRRSEEAAAELVNIAGQMFASGRRGDLALFLRNDLRFHRLLLEASANPMFAHLADVVDVILQGKHRFGLVPRLPNRVALDNHVDLAHAVQHNDAEAAREACISIVRQSAEELQVAR